MPDELVAMMASSGMAASIFAIRSRLISSRSGPFSWTKSTPSKALWMSFSKTSLFCDALSAMPSSRRVGQLLAINSLNFCSAPGAGSVARTSNPRARKNAAQLAPITPVPTIPMLLMLIFFFSVFWVGVTLLLGFGAFPHEGGCHHCAAGRKRSRGTQMKVIAFDLHNARLGLANPTGKERDIHRMSESLLCFVDVEGTRVCDVSATFFRVFFRRSLEPIA